MKPSPKLVRTAVIVAAALAFAAVAAVVIVPRLRGGATAKSSGSASASNQAGPATDRPNQGAAQANARYADLKASDFDEVKVTKTTDQTVIEASGNLEPARATDLSFPIAGTVASVGVAAGARVATGQALARLDDAELRYQLANVENQLRKAEISGNRKDAELLALELGLKRTQLSKATLLAPYAGVVSAVNVSVGDSVGASTAALRVIDRSSLVAVLEIDEIDLPAVKVGQKTFFSIDALGDKEYEGRVSSIPPEGRVTSQGLAVFDVEARIENPPAELLPAYSFSARIIASAAREILSVPKAAVTSTPRGQMVFTKAADGTIKPKTIEATQLADGSWEIVSGLAEGDVVLVRKSTGNSNNRNGANFMLMGPGGPPPGETGRPQGASGSTNRGGNP